MKKVLEFIINKETCSEILNITKGVFSPLKGFLNSKDYKNVVQDMHLLDGSPWPIPVTLDIPKEKVSDFKKASKVLLKDLSGNTLAKLQPEEVFKVNLKKDVMKIFGTDDLRHPGVLKEKSRSLYRVGGRVELMGSWDTNFLKYSLTPEATRKYFAKKGWKTITGFQTRNPIHRAHEHLQRTALSITDGLYIQPLVGWKKKGDFSSLAVMKSYEKMMEKFYYNSKTLLGVLETPMRYAGPREAVFHALIRKNFGCTHFIVGRDHAGVGNFYGKYDAHKMCDRFKDLGIKILKLYGPFYCKKCKDVVTEDICRHEKGHILSISGTHIRSQLSIGKKPSEFHMRKEIAKVLMGLKKIDKLFIKEACYEL